MTIIAVYYLTMNELFSGLSPWFLTVFACLATFIFKQDNSQYLNSFKFPDPVLNESYDFIIIGAGSAGSVIANRLSEVKDWNILLVEAGGEEDIISDTPLLAPTLWQTDKDWNYTTVQQKYSCRANKRICDYPRGHVLGGTSTLNYMVYVRGNKWDFDNWKNLGNDGWGYQDVLPYFLKSEDMKITNLAKDDKYHSTGGYLTVEKSRYVSSLQNDFIKAGMEFGYEVRDYNGESQTGIAYPQFTMRNGSRCSTSKAFLTIIKDRQNVHISKRTLALNIELNNKNNLATEVTLLRNRKQLKVKARKEIIISAGAIDSPKLLMLSGIGPKEHLNEVGIKTRVNLPVGKNLVDHVGLPTLFTINKNVTLIRKTVETIETIQQYALNKTGPLSSMVGIDAVGYFASNGSKISLPDFQYFFLSLASFDYVDPVVLVTATKLRPESVGEVRLNTSDPMNKPIIDPRYLDHPSDVTDTVNACLIVLEYMKTESMAKYNPEILAKGTPCEGKKNVKYCECAAQNLTQSLLHPTGTARMSKTGVVSPNLNVWGIKNLRVADASIMPSITSGNTNAPAIMIGEKAADIIKKQWNAV